MSCGQTGPSSPYGVGCTAPPCVPSSVAQESTASMLDNLSLALFGPISKSTVAGRTVWSAPCTGYQSGVPGLPMNANEGFLCYVIRLISLVGLFNGGVWNASVTYPAQTVVAYGVSLYVSLVSNTSITPGTNAAVWQLLLTAPQGNPGNPGPPGPAGGSSSPDFAARVVTTNTTLANTDGVVVCKNTSPMTVTVAAGSTYDAGKYFYVKQSKTGSSAAITIQFTGTDRLDGSASYILNTPGENVTFFQEAQTGVWNIL